LYREEETVRTQNSQFAGWSALKRRLDENGCLRVVERHGYEWVAATAWNEPMPREQIAQLKKNLDVPVPEVYASFLAINDGCTLFKDVEFGQRGFYLYSSEELVSKRAVWAKIYPEWPSNYLVFGECLGDSDLLVMDIELPSVDGTDCAVLCFPSAYFPERKLMSEAFQKWLDYLIIAQGAKFWNWR
jgi:hypothetical protein